MAWSHYTCHHSGLEISQHYTLATAVLWRDKEAVFWTCTKSQNVCGESHHGITLPQPSIPLPQTSFFHPCFCQKPMIKCTYSDLYSSIVPWQRFHPHPHLSSCALHPFLHSSVAMHLFLTMGQQVNICIFSTRCSDIQTSQLFENGIWQESTAMLRAHRFTPGFLLD